MSRLPYPDVPHPKIYEIYERSLHEPIHAYGFFVDPIALYDKKREHRQSNRPVVDDVRLFLWELREELLGIGLNQLMIKDVPAPKKYRRMYPRGSGWLVILGTGFNKTPHVPISDELTQRVRNIIEVEKPPAWWSMRLFSYPHPQLWIRDNAKMQANQK